MERSKWSYLAKKEKGKEMSYLHTYELECECGNKMTAEMHKKINNYPLCFLCGKEMSVTFYLRSADTRAGGN
jgi:hypothetical protein